MTADRLPDTWRGRAETLRPYSAAAAEAFTRAASELEAAIAEDAGELLTLSEAAAESGYSPRRIRELTKSGEIPNRGRRGAPRFRRADLPRRTKGTSSSYDPSEDAIDIMRRRMG